MILLLTILLFFFEIYIAFLFVYFTILYLRKRKLPKQILAIEIVVVGVFYYVKLMVEKHKIIFWGEYADGTRIGGVDLQML